VLEGRDWAKMTREDVRRETRHIQMVFQDPFGSLNPRRKAAELVAQGPIVHGTPRAQAIAKRRSCSRWSGSILPPPTATRTNSPAASASALASARALALKPDVLVADEPVSRSMFRAGAGAESCLPNCGRGSGSRSSSSRMTCAWPRKSAISSRS
jgi:peptide/nickel transport system ATP-binding protein